MLDLFKPEFEPKPLTLENGRVRLEPIARDHANALFVAGSDKSIWRYMPRPMFKDLSDAQGWVNETLDLVESGSAVVFAIIDAESNQPVGSTRFLNIERAHRGLEIGWTWLALKAQRTGINTNCKYLLLTHAFEDLGAIRVQLKTDSRNRQSQTAIERIGARREGVLRKHMIMWDKHERNTVMYSIIDKEWPEIKAQLRLKLL